jgi:hypothetical protein
MADLTPEKRHKMPKSSFAGPGESFPISDQEHARLAVGGATRSYNAGNISESTKEHVQAKAHAALARYRAKDRT